MVFEVSHRLPFQNFKLFCHSDDEIDIFAMDEKALGIRGAGASGSGHGSSSGGGGLVGSQSEPIVTDTDVSSLFFVYYN